MTGAQKSPAADPWRVVVTRARSQSSGLVDRLASRGMEVIELPVIAIEDPEDGGSALRAAGDRLVSGHYAWVVLTSPNAASRLIGTLGSAPVPSSVRWATVGTGTARTLSDAGLTAELVATGSLAESLADEFPTAEPTPDPAVCRVLFPRAETVRPVLAEGLEVKGWTVDQVVAYRTVAGDPNPSVVERARTAEAIALTSSSTVVRTLELLGRDGIPQTVVSIGPVTTHAAEAAGLTVAREASPHSLDGLVEAVVAAFEERRSTERRQQAQQQQ